MQFLCFIFSIVGLFLSFSICIVLGALFAYLMMSDVMIQTKALLEYQLSADEREHLKPMLQSCKWLCVYLKFFCTLMHVCFVCYVDLIQTHKEVIEIDGEWYSWLLRPDKSSAIVMEKHKDHSAFTCMLTLNWINRNKL